MPQRTKLTDTSIRNLKPDTGQITHWDSVVPGMGLRVSPGGTKSFIVFIGSGRRQTIGRYPHIGLAAARDEAKKALAERTLGYDKPKHTAFSVARERFLADCAHLKPRTQYDYKRFLTLYFDFRGSVADVGPSDILSRLNKLSDRPSEKHHAFKVIRTFFNWCLRNHYVEHHPMRKMAAPRQNKPRERVLTDEELVTVYRTARNGRGYIHAIVHLLILTGQRRGEIARLEWDWMRDGTVTLPGTVTKNGHPHTFPLCPEAQERLRSLPRVNVYCFPAQRNRRKGQEATVFNGWSKAVRSFKNECGIHDWTLHDIRRTVSSGLASLGVDQLVTEKLLNHLTGSQSDIARVYNRYSYLAEMRDAVDRWQDHLHTLSRE